MTKLQQHKDYYQKIRFSREDFLDWNKWYEDYTKESRQNKTTNADFLAWLEYEKCMNHAETPELEIKLNMIIEEFKP